MSFVGVVDLSEPVLDAESEAGGRGVAEALTRIPLALQAGAQGQKTAKPVFGAEVVGGIQIGGDGQALDRLDGESDPVMLRIAVFFAR